ncbi:MAG: hypothetical protein HGJ94_01190 [Desulfosarcina sp.]|nr:hypothetical protein [Desulfosarcina sp.]MBC2741912.1 hypothetical protein [Desulfosarcina sp.]MBC2764825.1 hypothetical protein [Desulfosarcina sp.]
MKRPVRTTLVYGLISALAVMPAAWLFAGPIGWPMAFKLALWMDLFFYTVLLARWGGKSLIAIVFPMALLLGTALWPGVYSGFFFLGLGVFSWIRSGICFSGTPVRAVAAEIITVAGGAGLVALLGPGSTVTWSIGIWLFFLVQALYFFIVPATDPSDTVRTVEDSFELAHREAQRVLDEGMAG